MPAKGFQMCLKRIVFPKEHGHPQTCLDGFGLRGNGINNSAKSKTPLGWEFVVLARNLAAERKAFPGWKPEENNLYYVLLGSNPRGGRGRKSATRPLSFPDFSAVGKSPVARTTQGVG